MKRILISEAHDATRMLIYNLLTVEKYGCSCVDNGDDLKSLINRNFSLFIVDGDDDAGGGEEVRKKLDGSLVPAMFISTQSLTSRYPVLRKPFRNEALLDMVRFMIGVPE